VSMVRDADLSLANWLARVLPPGTGVRFDAPRAAWEGRVSGSAFVSVFLCTVRRDTRDLPRSGWSEMRDQDGRLVGRQQTARYYRLSYLVTAWAAAAEDGGGDETSRQTLEEHELLGLLIDACTRTDTIAADHLAGTLAESGIPCFVRCAEDDDGRSSESLWPGFGIAPHAHLELELTAAVVPPLETELAPPAREIVAVARQKPALGPSGSAAAATTAAAAASGPNGPAPARPPGTVRRWERTTIIEPATGRSEPAPRAPQSED